jgi:hypothetical protein
VVKNIYICRKDKFVKVVTNELHSLELLLWMSGWIKVPLEYKVCRLWLEVSKWVRLLDWSMPCKLLFRFLAFFSQTPRHDENTPNKAFRSGENEGNHFRFADDETINNWHICSLAKLRCLSAHYFASWLTKLDFVTCETIICA